MLQFEPGTTVAHGLDPRSKLGFQIGFAIAALGHTSSLALAVLSGVTGFVLLVSATPLRRSLYTYRFPILMLGVAPLIASISLLPPGFDLGNAVEPARASYRVVLILLVSAAYIRTTPIRDSRAALQRTVPGKPGVLLGMGIALIYRFLPVIQDDFRTIQQASATRLGDQRGVIARGSHIGLYGMTRSFDRAENLAAALETRCFAWNPTLPVLSFSSMDGPALLLAVALTLSAVL